MSRRCLAAFTPAVLPYPPYVSINQEDGEVEITVRAPANEDGSCGRGASMKMTTREFEVLITEAYLRLHLLGGRPHAEAPPLG